MHQDLFIDNASRPRCSKYWTKPQARGCFYHCDLLEPYLLMTHLDLFFRSGSPLRLPRCVLALLRGGSDCTRSSGRTSALFGNIYLSFGTLFRFNRTHGNPGSSKSQVIKMSSIKIFPPNQLPAEGVTDVQFKIWK